MFHSYRPSAFLALSSLLLGYLLVTAPELASAAPADRGPGTATTARPGAGHGRHPVEAFEQHRWFTAEHGAPHPVAATYLDLVGWLAVADRSGGRTRITLLDASRDQVVGRMRVSGLGSATTLADNTQGTLAALSGRRLLTWPTTRRGLVHPRVQQVTGVSLGRPAGMAWDQADDSWLVLDAAGRRLVRLAGHGPSVSASVEPAPLPTTNALRGLGVDPASGLIYVGVPRAERLEVLSPTDTLHQTLDISDVAPTSLRTLAFGPTADPTDDSATTGLYLTDAGTTTGDAPVLGQVSAVSLTPLGAAAVTAQTTSAASLVRSTPLWQLSPPVPDSSGIAYMPDKDRLMVVDSEVEEMGVYQGVNMWQISRNGSLLDTGTTHGDPNYSREPTGVGYDPVGKRVFISDDDKEKVFEVTAGPDSRFGTSDDSISSISTLAFGDDDAEDVAYDTANRSLYITQGVGEEVWRVDPGTNGRFDGVAPTGDDQVTHFDTSVYGLTDLEGIGYSPTRNSLFLMDRKYTQVVEVTPSGDLVQDIDVSAIGMNNPADITLAPATNDPSRISMYVVTRGVDNDNHPDENDGMMYELSAPTLGPVEPGANTAPMVNAGGDSTVVMPAAAILNGTVTDDGRPNPPGATATTWTKVSGPGTVTFTDNHAVDTTATFSTPGTYVLRLSSSDGILSSADDVSVTVQPVNTAPRVGVGPDLVVRLPYSLTITATATDDGLPTPASLRTTWEQASGPGTATFTAPDQTSTEVAFSSPGSYQLRLRATDSALDAADTLTVTVQPATQTLTLDRGPATRTAGARVRLTGLLTRTVGGLPLADVPVTVHAYRAPHWRRVELGTVTTAVDGWFTVTDSPRVTTRYVAVSEQGSSTTVTVRVRPRLTGHLTRSHVHRGARTVLRGVVAPSDRGQLLRLQRWNGHRWVTQARHRMRHGAQVGYRFTVRMRTPGRHLYRVVANAYHGRMSTTTHTLVLHVRR